MSYALKWPTYKSQVKQTNHFFRKQNWKVALKIVNQNVTISKPVKYDFLQNNRL